MLLRRHKRDYIIACMRRGRRDGAHDAGAGAGSDGAGVSAVKDTPLQPAVLYTHFRGNGEVSLPILTILFFFSLHTVVTGTSPMRTGGAKPILILRGERKHW